MYTEHEAQIKVMLISYEKGDEKVTIQRIQRLHRFVEHLGFLVGAFLSNQDNTVRLFIEPHKCPCSLVPYKENFKMIDALAIDEFLKNNALYLVKLESLKNYIADNGSTEELNEIELDIDKLERN